MGAHARTGRRPERALPPWEGPYSGLGLRPRPPILVLTSDSSPTRLRLVVLRHADSQPRVTPANWQGCTLVELGMSLRTRPLSVPDQLSIPSPRPTGRGRGIPRSEADRPRSEVYRGPRPVPTSDLGLLASVLGLAILGHVSTTSRLDRVCNTRSRRRRGVASLYIYIY